jgi:hypothetical protein
MISEIDSLEKDQASHFMLIEKRLSDLNLKAEKDKANPWYFTIFNDVAYILSLWQKV